MDFVYKGHAIIPGKPKMSDGGAQSYGTTNECSTLRVDLGDKILPITLSLYYTTFDACDVIVRKTTIGNDTDEAVRIEGLASCNLIF